MRRRRRGRDRAARQAAIVGRAIRLHRRIEGATIAQSAARAGLARSTLERIERGAPSATLATIVAAADAVGLDLICQPYPGRPMRLRDSGQLAIAQSVVMQAAPAWSVSLEEAAGEHGESADLVLWGAREILHVEIERFVLDWQSQLRRARIKRDWLAARHQRPVRLVLLVADSAANRAAVSPFLAVLRASFGSGSREVMHAVRTGKPLGSDGLAWVRVGRKAVAAQADPIHRAAERTTSAAGAK